jgi:TolB protein
LRKIVLVGALLVAVACSHVTDDRDGDPPEPECPPTGSEYAFPTHHENATWSPQGLIAFEDKGIVWVDSVSHFYFADTTLAGIWILNPETGERRRLLPRGKTPAWSPDGNSLAFSDNQIFTINSDGSDRRQVTSRIGGFYPAWSPDGQQIAFDSNGGAPGPYYIWLVNADGSEPHNISYGGMGEWRMPNWHPDGFRIVHIRFPGVGPEIYVMDSRQGWLDSTRLTQNEAWDTNPVYSPDGSLIAYNSAASSGHDRLPQIWIMQADGSHARQITSKGGTHPSWSPGRRRIVYTRENPNCNSPSAGVLWIVDVVSGVETQLTHKWPLRAPTTLNRSLVARRVAESSQPSSCGANMMEKLLRVFEKSTIRSAWNTLLG